MKFRIPFDESVLREFCKQHGIVELAFFGSALRDGFRDDSDVDVLVCFAPDVHYGLFDIVRLQDELSSILGRPVDLVEHQSVEKSENYIRRRHILSHMERVYVA
jgi:predicted nucleotidyltransferase